ncbi:MAG: ketose-bisphosphate aldolase [Planctomycetota bacterium]
MPFVPMRQIVAEARKGRYGVGAYNVNNMEQIQALMQGASELNAPIILQASRGALQYSNMVYLKHLMLAAVEDNPELPVACHLDHGPDLETCRAAIGLGFTSVMIDGSIDYGREDENGAHPARSFEENIAVTREIVEYAHPLGVSVEGELGTLGGIEDDTQAASVHLTDPDQVEEFVAQTGVDALAIAIGTSHGAYKFKEEPTLALDLIPQIREKAGDTALVMHGSSSVPQDLVAIINQHGGNLQKSMGVPIEQIKEGIKLGVQKINIDTDGRLAFTGNIRKYLDEHPEVFDQRKYLAEGRRGIYEVMKGKMVAFGTAGHAGDYEPMTLEDAKAWYN